MNLPPLLIEKLPSGLRVVAIQKRGLPLFHARLSLPAGACEDPRGKAGLASFTTELLRRGTKRRPARDVDDMIESMGAQLYEGASMEEAALADASGAGSAVAAMSRITSLSVRKIKVLGSLRPQATYGTAKCVASATAGACGCRLTVICRGWSRP